MYHHIPQYTPTIMLNVKCQIVQYLNHFLKPSINFMMYIWLKILRKNDLIDCHCNFPDLILALKKTVQQKYKLYLQLLWKRRGILH